MAANVRLLICPRGRVTQHVDGGTSEYCGLPMKLRGRYMLLAGKNLAPVSLRVAIC